MFCCNLGGFSCSVVKTIQAWYKDLINFLNSRTETTESWVTPERWYHCFSKIQSMPSHTDQKVYSSEVNGSQEQTSILTDGADCPGGMDWGEGKTLMAWSMRIFLLEGGIFLTVDNFACGNVTPDFSSQLHWWKSSLVLGTLSHTLADHGLSRWGRIQEPYKHFFKIRYKAGGVFISVRKQRGCSCGLSLGNRTALRGSTEIHLGSFTLCLCSQSYPSGHNLLFCSGLGWRWFSSWWLLQCCGLDLGSECWEHRDVLAVTGQGCQRAKEFSAPHPTHEGLGGHKEPRGDTYRMGDPNWPRGHSRPCDIILRI